MTEGNNRVIVTAIHDGHSIRDDLRPYLNLMEHERLREEDPYTEYLTDISDSRIAVYTSRFEVDLNRPRHKAVYGDPNEAWGLDVWRWNLPHDKIERSLSIYDAFYTSLESFLQNMIDRHKQFVVLDLHTYNHRRDSPYEEAAAIFNPEINIGTASVKPAWRYVVSNFIQAMSRQTIKGHAPDVRENIKFKGGEFSSWINRRFGDYGCAIAVELKKSFMDEWNGRVDIHHLNQIKTALKTVIPELLPHPIELTPSRR